MIGQYDLKNRKLSDDDNQKVADRANRLDAAGAHGGHSATLKEAERRGIGYQTLINDVLARHVRRQVA